MMEPRLNDDKNIAYLSFTDLASWNKCTENTKYISDM